MRFFRSAFTGLVMVSAAVSGNLIACAIFPFLILALASNWTISNTIVIAVAVLCLLQCIYGIIAISLNEAGKLIPDVTNTTDTAETLQWYSLAGMPLEKGLPAGIGATVAPGLTGIFSLIFRTLIVKDKSDKVAERLSMLLITFCVFACFCAAFSAPSLLVNLTYFLFAICQSIQLSFNVSDYAFGIMNMIIVIFGTLMFLALCVFQNPFVLDQSQPPAFLGVPVWLTIKDTELIKNWLQAFAIIFVTLIAARVRSQTTWGDLEEQRKKKAEDDANDKSEPTYTPNSKNGDETRPEVNVGSKRTKSRSLLGSGNSNTSSPLLPRTAANNGNDDVEASVGFDRNSNDASSSCSTSSDSDHYVARKANKLLEIVDLFTGFLKRGFALFKYLLFVLPTAPYAAVALAVIYVPSATSILGIPVTISSLLSSPRYVTFITSIFLVLYTLSFCAQVGIGAIVSRNAERRVPEFVDKIFLHETTTGSRQVEMLVNGLIFMLLCVSLRERSISVQTLVREAPKPACTPKEAYEILGPRRFDAISRFVDEVLKKSPDTIDSEPIRAYVLGQAAHFANAPLAALLMWARIVIANYNYFISIFAAFVAATFVDHLDILHAGVMIVVLAFAAMPTEWSRKLWSIFVFVISAVTGAIIITNFIQKFNLYNPEDDVPGQSTITWEILGLPPEQSRGESITALIALFVASAQSFVNYNELYRPNEVIVAETFMLYEWNRFSNHEVARTWRTRFTLITAGIILLGVPLIAPPSILALVLLLIFFTVSVITAYGFSHTVHLWTWRLTMVYSCLAFLFVALYQFEPIAHTVQDKFDASFPQCRNITDPGCLEQIGASEGENIVLLTILPWAVSVVAATAHVDEVSMNIEADEQLKAQKKAEKKAEKQAAKTAREGVQKPGASGTNTSDGAESRELGTVLNDDDDENSNGNKNKNKNKNKNSSSESRDDDGENDNDRDSSSDDNDEEGDRDDDDENSDEDNVESTSSSRGRRKDQYGEDTSSSGDDDEYHPAFVNENENEADGILPSGRQKRLGSNSTGAASPSPLPTASPEDPLDSTQVIRKKRKSRKGKLLQEPKLVQGNPDDLNAVFAKKKSEKEEKGKGDQKRTKKKRNKSLFTTSGKAPRARDMALESFPFLDQLALFILTYLLDVGNRVVEIIATFYREYSRELAMMSMILVMAFDPTLLGLVFGIFILFGFTGKFPMIYCILRSCIVYCYQFDFVPSDPVEVRGVSIINLCGFSKDQTFTGSNVTGRLVILAFFANLVHDSMLRYDSDYKRLARFIRKMNRMVGAEAGYELSVLTALISLSYAASWLGGWIVALFVIVLAVFFNRESFLQSFWLRAVFRILFTFLLIGVHLVGLLGENKVVDNTDEWNKYFGFSFERSTIITMGVVIIGLFTISTNHEVFEKRLEALRRVRGYDTFTEWIENNIYKLDDAAELMALSREYFDSVLPSFKERVQQAAGKKSISDVARTADGQVSTYYGGGKILEGKEQSFLVDPRTGARMYSKKTTRKANEVVAIGKLDPPPNSSAFSSNSNHHHRDFTATNPNLASSAPITGSNSEQHLLQQQHHHHERPSATAAADDASGAESNQQQLQQQQKPQDNDLRFTFTFDEFRIPTRNFMNTYDDEDDDGGGDSQMHNIHHTSHPHFTQHGNEESSGTRVVQIEGDASQHSNWIALVDHLKQDIIFLNENSTEFFSFIMGRAALCGFVMLAFSLTGISFLNIVFVWAGGFTITFNEVANVTSHTYWQKITFALYLLLPIFPLVANLPPVADWAVANGRFARVLSLEELQKPRDFDYSFVIVLFVIVIQKRFVNSFTRAEYIRESYSAQYSRQRRHVRLKALSKARLRIQWTRIYNLERHAERMLAQIRVMASSGGLLSASPGPTAAAATGRNPSDVAQGQKEAFAGVAKDAEANINAQFSNADDEEHEDSRKYFAEFYHPPLDEEASWKDKLKKFFLDSLDNLSEYFVRHSYRPAETGTDLKQYDRFHRVLLAFFHWFQARTYDVCCVILFINALQSGTVVDAAMFIAWIVVASTVYPRPPLRWIEYGMVYVLVAIGLKLFIICITTLAQPSAAQLRVLSAFFVRIDTKTTSTGSFADIEDLVWDFLVFAALVLRKELTLHNGVFLMLDEGTEKRMRAEKKLRKRRLRAEKRRTRKMLIEQHLKDGTPLPPELEHITTDGKWSSSDDTNSSSSTSDDDEDTRKQRDLSYELEEAKKNQKQNSINSNSCANNNRSDGLLPPDPLQETQVITDTNLSSGALAAHGEIDVDNHHHHKHKQNHHHHHDKDEEEEEKSLKEKFVEFWGKYYDCRKGIGQDSYLVSVCFLALALFVFIFGYFSIAGGTGSLITALESDLLPGTLVVVICALTLVLIIDRAAYLLVNTYIKAAVHTIFSLIAIVGYIIYRDVHPHPNFAGYAFFAFLWAYLVVSASQVKAGFPRQRRHDPFTPYPESSIRETLYTVYMAIPFLWEMRTCIDWTFTLTSLSFEEWFKVEDVLQMVYARRTNLLNRPPRLGEKQGFGAKFVGLIKVLFIAVVLLFPLMNFSTFNPNTVKNSITRMSLTIQFGQVSPIYESATFTATPIPGDYPTWLAHAFPGLIPLGVTNSFKSIQLIELTPCSAELWTISPQGLRTLNETLDQVIATNGTIPLQVTLSAAREYTSNEASLEITNPTTQQLDVATATQMKKALTSTTGDVSAPVAQLFTPIQLNQPAGITAYETIAMGCNLTLRAPEYNPELSTDVRYWCVECPSLFSRGNIPNSTFPEWNCITSGTGCSGSYNFDQTGIDSHTTTSLYAVFISDDVAQSFGFLAGIGIIAFYTTFVLAVGNALRGMFSSTAHYAVFTDMAHPLHVHTLLQYLELARFARPPDLQTENRVYLQLIDLLRSPETLLRFTGRMMKLYKSNNEVRPEEEFTAALPDDGQLQDSDDEGENASPEQIHANWDAEFNQDPGYAVPRQGEAPVHLSAIPHAMDMENPSV